MIDRRSLLSGAAATGVLASLPMRAAPPARGDSPGDAAALKLLAETAEALLAAYPEYSAYLGLDTGARAGLKARLTDRSAAAERARSADASVRLAALRSIPSEALSPTVQTHLAVASEAFRLGIEGWRRLPAGDMALLSSNNYRSTPYVVTQGNGAFVDTPDLLETKHAVVTRADAEAYVARIEAYAGQLAAETQRIEADADDGVMLPAFLNDLTVRQLTAGAERPEGWGLVTSFGEKTRAAGVTGDWQAQAAKLCAERVAPALRRQAETIAALRARAPEGPGMWGLPDAADRYAWLVEAATTTRGMPEEIHTSGLDQCRALSAQMDALLNAQGLTQGTVGARMTELGKRPDLLFANDDAGRAKLLAYLETVVAELRPRLPRAFGKLVRGNLVIKRVPPAIEQGAPNGYAGPGSLDGKTPGIYYINLKDTGIWPRFALPTLTFHEGIPGHIWQGEYTFDLPLIRTLLAFNAYSEGWGLYAEQIGDELGFYERDPLGRLGYLQSMLFRATRLVVDTGLHHKRWTLAQARQFFTETTGQTGSQARSETNRYCAWPGQALGYKTGHNEINRLRDAAKARMGPRFDMRAFNDTVVQAGGMPLAVLAQVVERWSGA